MWGHCVQLFRSCCFSVFPLKIPTMWGFPHLALQDQALPFQPLKAKTAGAPPVHHQLQGEVGGTPPSSALVSWEQSEGDTGSQSLCKQGINCQLGISVGVPWS